MKQLKQAKRYIQSHGLWDVYNALPIMLIGAIGVFKALGWINF